MNNLANKLWGFCNTLRHDGVDYGDYIEQLTYLLFFKMAEEKDIDLPSIESYKDADDNEIENKEVSWVELKKQSGVELTHLYGEVLRHLRKQEGIIGDMYFQAMPRLNNPTNLKKLIALIDEEDWTSIDVDVKGEAFEALLEKSASEGKKGAGQYFTPRPLIKSMVRLTQPDPFNTTEKEFKVYDPSCGTGGFLVSAYEWLFEQKKGAFKREEIPRIKKETYYGQELVPRPRRLALMNMYLHNIEPIIYLGDTIYEEPKSERFDVVLANPPFGTKGANNAPARQDFTIETTNKQLNFLQHILTVLKPGGRAAVVLPDNCLFEDKAGDVFKILMQDCNLHTILRLPNGTFVPYANAKANVIFFQKGMPTENVWIYDNRTNIPSLTKKDRPLSEEHFVDFEKSFGKDVFGNNKRKESSRFKSFNISEIKERNYKLDITWLKEENGESENGFTEPSEIISQATTELKDVIKDLNKILKLIGDE
ncbi:N-6 DNA methylase [Marinifilum sp.]|uniref:class I SAM-dependent DNA methyltransferase n=1 Tax=Marinifilum sp. TaxID=2033137 RepID=UPI003BAAA445